MKLRHSLALSVFSLLLVASLSRDYTFTFDNTYGHLPTYSLGWISDGYTVLVNLTTTANGTTEGAVELNATSSPLSVTLSATTPNISTIKCVMNTTSTTKFAFWACSITYSSYYILNITKAGYPTTDGTSGNTKVLQYFQMTASSYFNRLVNVTNATGSLTNQTYLLYNNPPSKILVKATDTIRDRLVKLIYLNQSSINVTLYPIRQKAAIKVTLNPIKKTTNLAGSAFDFRNSQALTWTSSDTIDLTPTTNTNDSSRCYYIDSFNTSTSLVNGTNITVNTTKQFLGYYLLTLSYVSDVNTSDLNFIRITFPSESYACPHSASFPDYHANFQPCIGSGSGAGGSESNTVVPGYPCTGFSSTLNKCTQCATGYILSAAGLCLFNTDCPKRQYYHFGACNPVDPSCDGYDSFTGACTSCIDPLKIVSFGNCVTDTTKVVNCTSRQYKSNNKCFDVSPLCNNFNPTTGGCTTCIDGYELSTTSAACFPKKVVCGNNQYIKNGVCVDLPNNCPGFNPATQKCETCAFGYYPNNGDCQKIFCATGKVPSKQGISCIDVSPACNKQGQYDSLTGNCLKCKDDSYTIQNGVCVQNTNPLSGCAARQTLGFGSCGNAQQNCQIYNLVSGDCDKCLPGWFKDFSGVCSLQNNNQGCRGDEMSVQGYCLQKPANCLIVDNLGLCASCNGTQFQLQNGQCVLIITCPAGQYLSNGVCINAPATCSNGSFNPATGVCLTCNDGTSAVNGLCCSANQVAYGGQCIESSAYSNIVNSASNTEVPTCIAWHPSLGSCLECNGNYTPDPISPEGCS